VTRTVETLMVWRRLRAGDSISAICRAYGMTTGAVMRALRIEGRARRRP